MSTKKKTKCKVTVVGGSVSSEVNTSILQETNFSRGHFDLKFYERFLAKDCGKVRHLMFFYFCCTFFNAVIRKFFCWLETSRSSSPDHKFAFKTKEKTKLEFSGIAVKIPVSCKSSVKTMHFQKRPFESLEINLGTT